MSKLCGRSVVFGAALTGLALIIFPAMAEEPAPQINAQDIVKTFSAPTADHKTPGCDRSSWKKGADGAPEHHKCATLGFNLGKEMEAAPAAPTKNHDTAPHRRTAALTALPLPADPSFNLLLTFNLDSADLTDQAMANVREFAKAVQDPKLSSLRFQIEGYTDASGSRAYNMNLSKKRAEAAVAYLVAQGVDRSRLQSKGFGPALVRPDLPNDEANRRVIARRAP